MAVLKNRITGNKVVLRSHHVFGRSSKGVDTQLECRDISNIHASIRWDGDGWTVIDHSRNGTWVEGRRLASNAGRPLRVGDSIRFGGAESSTWRIVDVNAPSTVLVPVQGTEEIIELRRFHALPNEESPDISIYMSDRGQWQCESRQGIGVLEDGDLVHCGDHVWRFFCAAPVDGTMEMTEIRSMRNAPINFDFKVSLDEEHVSLKIGHGDAVLDLGERVHHYLLLMLARQRMDDASRIADVEGQGWLDLSELSKMMGLESSHLNIQIFRARKQVAQALPEVPHLPAVVERRAGSVRFGFDRFEIMRGSTLEGAMIGD
ncbi:MAG: FHA domain-containing protein [Alteromonadaceae bacterium]|nr:MAG: FHA domain-containing protein [Alteromonadaceae bacterium]